MIPCKITTTPQMRLRLELKKRCTLFWLKDIRDVDITQCCAKCFIGAYDPHFWDATHDKSEGIVDVIVKQHPDAKAYYLCGLSAGCVWKLNTHVAFVPDPNSEIHIDNDRIKLDITNARRINFWDYTPNPPGNFTQRQRTCRNWIFANYIKDGMPL